jgi:hypothetical protein
LQGERKNPADRNPKVLNRRGRNREEAVTGDIVAEGVNDVNRIFGFFFDGQCTQMHMANTYPLCGTAATRYGDGMNNVRVDLGPRGYDIAIVSGDGGNVGPFARQRAGGALAFVVGDDNTRPHAEAAAAALAAAGFRTTLEVLPPGEAQKALPVAARLYDRLADLNADRKTLVVAVGGGVVGDLAGFVAATFNRGLPLLMVPTTLLVIVDSSVGG